MKKRRNKLILFSVTLGLFGPFDFFIIFFSLNWYPAGTIIGGLFAFFLMGYTIAKHNIYDTDSKLKKAIVITSFYVILFGLYYLIMIALKNIFKFKNTAIFHTIIIVTLLLFIVLYEKIRNLITIATNRIIFQNRYNYRESLIKITKSLLSYIDPIKLINYLTKIIIDLFNTKTCFIIINDGYSNNYMARGYFENEKKLVTKNIEIDDEIIEFIKVLEFPIIIESIEEYYTNNIIANKFVNKFKKLNIYLCIPLFFNNKFIGIFNIGKKVSDQIFDAVDIDLIKTVSYNLEVSLFNAIKIQKEKDKLEKKNLILLNELQKLKNDDCFRDIIAESPNMLKILSFLKEISNLNTTVLITGESGTGKELIATIIHNSSLRKEMPFVKVNCAAIPHELLESEFFGHEKGSFTGAYTQHIGNFERATGGTILLDEIEELRLDLQSKLLRAIQEKKIVRVGGKKEIAIDVRIICISNRNLEEMVKQKSFREDLFYRINVIPIEIPPLRKRKEAIIPLFIHFLKKYCVEFNKSLFDITKEATEVLMNYDWPGNIRELQNIVYRILAITNESPIRIENLPDKIINKITNQTSDVEKINYRKIINGNNINLKKELEKIEKKIIEDAYTECGQNQRKTARMLNITHHGLQYKMNKYNITN